MTSHVEQDNGKLVNERVMVVWGKPGNEKKNFVKVARNARVSYFAEPAKKSCNIVETLINSLFFFFVFLSDHQSIC